jgi:hypothetical protein
VVRQLLVRQLVVRQQLVWQLLERQLLEPRDLGLRVGLPATGDGPLVALP